MKSLEEALAIWVQGALELVLLALSLVASIALVTQSMALVEAHLGLIKTMNHEVEWFRVVMGID